MDLNIKLPKYKDFVIQNMTAKAITHPYGEPQNILKCSRPISHLQISSIVSTVGH